MEESLQIPVQTLLIASNNQSKSDAIRVYFGQVAKWQVRNRDTSYQ